MLTTLIWVWVADIAIIAGLIPFELWVMHRPRKKK